LKEKVTSKDLLIVDGYNFIFSFFKSEGLSNEDLTYLREKLIEDLIWYKSQKDCDTIVVFDARNSSNIGRSAHIINDIKVIFSRKGRTADDVIEGLISKVIGYKRIFVVTSDYLQQQVIFRKNVYRKSTREFDIEIKDYKDKVKEDIKQLKEGSGRTFFSFEKRLDSKARKNFLDLREK
jgi:predicted RNA-binding protein with PIN domain